MVSTLEVPQDLSDQFSEDELTASICRSSFWEFVKEFWDEIIPEKPVWNWHIKYLCNMIQSEVEKVFRGEPREHDIIINVPPGTTKSTIFSVMLNAWALTRMPSFKFLGASYAYNLAQDLSRKTRDLVKCAKYQRLFAKVRVREEQDAKGHFITDKGGLRFAVGSGGVVIGMHFHLIVIDDPIDPQRSTSDTELKEVNRWIENTLSQRKVDKAITLTVIVMQRLSENDPSGYKLDKKKKGEEKIKHIRLPAELIDDDMPSPRWLVKKYKNGLLDTRRLSRKVLDTERKRGQYFYAGQYLQRPVPAEGGMFKVENIEIAPPPTKFKKIVRFWDKAATVDDGAHSVGFKMAQDLYGRYWILNVKRGQWDSGRRERNILQTARVDGFRTIVGLEQEGGSGGKESAQETAKRLAGFRVKITRPSGDKVARADSFSVQVNIGNVLMAPGDWNETLLDEFRHFPNSKYKDQVDAASGCFSLLIQASIEVGAL